MLWFSCSVLSASGANWSRVLGEFTGTGKAAKESVHAADDAVQIARKGTGFSEAAGREASHLGVDIGNRVAVRQALSKALRQEGGDAAALRLVDDLAEADLDVAVVYLRGGRRLKEAVPDVVTRARLAREGGAPAIATLGLRDAAPVEDFLKVDALVASRRVPAVVAGKPTLARLGEVLLDGSQRSSKFYARYIRGNEGKWVAGGALTLWMADPDAFQDAAGNLTEAGFRNLASLGGEVLASSLQGIAEGSKDAGQKVVVAVTRGYFSGPYTWTAWLGIAVVIYVAGLALPITRWLFLKPLSVFVNPTGSAIKKSKS